MTLVLLAAVSLCAITTLALRGDSQRGRNTIYHLGPQGSDARDGKTEEAAWKTFRHAIPQLKPGDTLTLLPGTITGSNSGYPHIDCATNAKNGKEDAPITITAKEERQSFLRGDGSEVPLQIQNCSYWQVIGLHIENGDFAHEPDGRGDSGASVVYLDHDNHLVLRRNLLARSNRYFNSHLILGTYTSYSLFEENEFYYFHRHALNLSYGGWNTVRRNYFNSRFYADLPGCDMNPRPGVPRCSALSAQDRGDSGISLYPDQDSVIENNIGENNLDLMDIEAAYKPNASDDERFYGNVSLNDVYGIINTARGSSDALTSHHTLYQDIVVLTPTKLGAAVRSVVDFTCNRCTFIAGEKSVGNFASDQNPDYPAGGHYSVHVKNSLALNARKLGAFGFFVNTTKGEWLWDLDHVNAYNNELNYWPAWPNAHIRSALKKDPELGSCLVWVPEGSPMKHAGIHDTDIGASVLYRYEDGKLTQLPLWDPATGEFPHGAIVTGVNDVKGASALDVNQRLNVGVNGCPLPASYPKPARQKH